MTDLTNTNHNKNLNPPDLTRSDTLVTKYSEGVRTRKLVELINKSLLETVHSFSYEKIATTFPELAKNNGPELMRNYRGAVTRWEQECKLECYQLMDKYDIRQKLNYIDHCLKTQVPLLPPKQPPVNLESYKLSTAPKASELFTATPDAIIRATEIKTVQEELRRVKKQRVEVETNNERLCEEITRLNDRLKGINTTFHDRLKTITSLLDFTIPHPTPPSTTRGPLSGSSTNGASKPPTLVRPTITESEEFTFL